MNAGLRAYGVVVLLAAIAGAADPVIAQEPQTAPALPQKIYTDSIGEEQFVTIGTLAAPAKGQERRFLLQLELTNQAAAVFTGKLAEHFATVADRKRYYQDPATYSQACRENPGKFRGHYSVLNPVLGGKKRYLPMETGQLKLRLEGQDEPIVAELKSLFWRIQQTETSTSPAERDSAAFSLTIYSGTDIKDAQKHPVLRIVKTYTVRPDDYSIDLALEFINLTDKQIEISLVQAGPTGLPREGFRGDMRQAAYAYLNPANSEAQPRLKPGGDLKKLTLGEPEPLGNSDDTDATLWVGQINKFFGSMMYLRPTEQGSLAAASYQAKFFISAAKESPESRTYLTSVEIPHLRLTPRETQKLSFDIFTGPKQRDVFNNPKNPFFKQIYEQLKYIGTIDFGYCAYDWLSLSMMWLLDVFSVGAFGNYGIAIIILVLLVRLVLHPLTKKSQVSMMRMQKLAPQMQKIKEKYADDKETLNREMMKLYKQQGAVPLLGCLPMFLQMPIWIALYTGLNAAVELRHAAYLPVWITDLAAPDALFAFPQPLPWIGATFNLLPILLAVAMFFQTKFGPQAAQPATTKEQAQQQKMMKYMFPGMMVLFFYKAPSGLTLYIMASTFAGLIDQYYVRRHIRRKEAEEAAQQITVRVPGKASRDSRPKKPKGPFWVKRG